MIEDLSIGYQLPKGQNLCQIPYGFRSVFFFFPREHRKSVREQLRKSVREYLALVRELSRSKLPANLK